MENKELERMINNAISDAAPDVFEEILKRCEESEAGSERKVVEVKPMKEKKKPVYKIAGTIAACLVVCIAGILFLKGGTADAAAIVGLDVNPSVELSVDKNSKVISADPINAEGVEILDGMDLKGTDMKVAANALVGSMLQKGYLNDISNSILVSVQSDDKAKADAMQKELSDSLNHYLESNAMSAAIMGQSVVSDKEIEEFANANNISVGKASLIKNLCAADSKLTEASLLKLSTQELVLLASEKETAQAQATTSYGDVNKSQYISKDKALEIALSKAGVSRSQVTRYKVEFECEDGIIVYDVEFYTGRTEYSAEIDATTGKIMEFEREYDDDYNDRDYDDDWDDDDYTYSSKNNSSKGGNSSYIGKSKAKDIALSRAGVSASDIYDYEIDLDDGVYEVEFMSGNMSYEVDVDAATGKVMKFDKEYDD